ncbi:MAG: bifunctional 3-hydroxydecanoyl-ACP dehydratase/trans-2-decenoyl-ACP isomerase [Hyphomicrobiales bacterium]
MSKFNKSSFTYNELIECAEGKLFGPGNAKLPLPPMLMFDKISHISEEGGIFSKGQIIAEMAIKDDLWFFDCHFQNDPVMPGCLGLDALWQLLGFYLGWLGRPGKGRALGVGEVKFFGMIDPSIKLIEYKVNIKKLVTRNLTLGVADGELLADGEKVYSAEGLKVGLFEN